VPVLRATRADGTIQAIVFGYACHCTVLDDYQFCGDYAGFAEIELERRFPVAQAMFVAGGGAGQNPVPRRRLAPGARLGHELATSAASALAGPMRSISGTLASSYVEIPLAFDKLPTKDQIEKDTTSDNFFIASRARHLLKQIESQGKLDSTYSYPVQVWK